MKCSSYAIFVFCLIEIEPVLIEIKVANHSSVHLVCISHSHGAGLHACACSVLLKPGAHPRVGNPEVTGIPQVDSSTRQRQLISTQAEVTYLTKPPITTKPVVRTN